MTTTNATPAKNENFREVREDSLVGRLKILVDTRYKSVAALSRAIGIPDSTIRSWFNGSQPGFKEADILSMAEKLGVSYEWLIMGEAASSQPLKTIDYSNQNLQKVVRLQKLLVATSNVIESLTLTPDQDDQDLKPLWGLLEQHINILSNALASYQANSGAAKEAH